MPDEQQMEAAAAYVRALRSGEGSAARRAAPHLAPDVIATTPAGELTGYDAVLAHITGNWPNTPVYLMGGWSEPQRSGDGVVIEGEFPAFGAGASGMNITFTFNDADQIETVHEEPKSGARPEPQPEIPLVVRGMINNALVNGTPIVVAYVNEAGEPELSLRGSTQVFSPTQISIWLRSAEGGLNRALERDPRITLLYRDSRSRSTLVIKGDAHITSDASVRDKVFELCPEVEQMHDPERRGAALVMDVREIRGGTPKGLVHVKP